MSSARMSSGLAKVSRITLNWLCSQRSSRTRSLMFWEHQLQQAHQAVTHCALVFTHPPRRR